MFFIGGLGLFGTKGGPSLAVRGAEADHIMGAMRRDGTSENTLAADSLAEVACKISCKPLARLPGHKAQVVANLLVRKQIEERRLFELGAEAVLECVIEDGIAGGVQKIGQDEGVFLCDRRFLPSKIKSCHASRANGYSSYDCNHQFPTRDRRVVYASFDAVVGRNRRDEPVTATGYSFDKTRALRRIPQRLAELVDRGIEAVVEIDERIR